MGKPLPWLVLILLLSATVFTTVANDRFATGDNIVITRSSETYRYAYSRERGAVVVEGEVVNQYTCNNFRDKAAFYRFFDGQTQLESVELFENGKKGAAATSLQDYAIEDIFYSDAKIYNLELTFPKSGWQNEVRLKQTITDPRYFCNVFFHEPYPVTEKTITVIVPAWMKAEVKEFNFEGYEVLRQHTVSEKDGADIYTWTLRHLPARKQEPRQPGATWVWPHLLVLSKAANTGGQSKIFFNTLADQYAWYRQVLSLCRNDVGAIRTKAAEITASAKTGLDKAKAILYWVYDNIRYVAFEDGIAGFKPDEAQNVLAKKYGDCKGMANLTKELLKAVGLDARLAWIGTNHIRYDYTTPSLCVDNHMICCLVYEGKKYYLDGTEQYLPMAQYAERIQGRQVLVENGDSFLLETIPAATAEQNLTLFSEVLQIHNDRLEGAVEYRFRGESKEQLLHAIHRSKKEKREAGLERYITNDNMKYSITGLQTADVEQVDGELWMKFNVRNAGSVAAFGNELYVDIDYNKTFDQLLIDSGRRFPFCFSYKHYYQTETVLQLPAGYKLASLPKDLIEEHPAFSFSCPR